MQKSSPYADRSIAATTNKFSSRAKADIHHTVHVFNTVAVETRARD